MRFWTPCAILLIASLFATVAHAQAVSRATLVPGWTTSDGAHMVGVRIDLAPGWKTYWRAPGGNGIPPQFDFAGSSNVERVGVYWPSPKVFIVGGVSAIGYSESVIFPVKIMPRSTGPVSLSLDLFYGVCEDVCVPMQEQLALALPTRNADAERDVRASYASRAKPAANVGMTRATCQVTPQGDDFAMRTVLEFRNRPPKTQAIVFETGSDNVYIEPLGETVSGRDITVDADVYNWSSGPLALDRSKLRITLLTSDGAVEIRGCPAG